MRKVIILLVSNCIWQMQGNNGIRISNNKLIKPAEDDTNIASENNEA